MSRHTEPWSCRNLHGGCLYLAKPNAVTRLDYSIEAIKAAEAAEAARPDTYSTGEGWR